jgi:hypothetical protein
MFHLIESSGLNLTMLFILASTLSYGKLVITALPLCINLSKTLALCMNPVKGSSICVQGSCHIVILVKCCVIPIKTTHLMFINEE